jgi:hypothetical protein
VSDLHAYLRAADDVAAKVIDGEAIIINLTTGNYYSTDQVGAVIWELIQQGRHNAEAIIASVTGRYDVARDQAQRDVQRLVEQLRHENLVSESSDPPAAGAGEEAKGAAVRAPYVTPALNVFRDMGDLLALDPPVPGLGDIAWKSDDEDPSR